MFLFSNHPIIYQNIDFENFPPIMGKEITLNPYTILYRSYTSNDPIISEYPAFYGKYDNPKKYILKKDYKMGKYMTTKHIRLLDIRYLKSLLETMIENKEVYNSNILTIIKILSLSFGLTSLYQQILLIKERYTTILEKKRKNKIVKKYMRFIQFYQKYENMENILSKPLFVHPIETKGYRFDEIINDCETIQILKGLFEENFDGIISPNLFSPSSKDDCLPCEIILFNPLKSNIILFNSNINVNHSIENVDILNILQFGRGILPEIFPNHKMIFQSKKKKMVKNKNDLFDSIYQEDHYIKMKEKIDFLYTISKSMKQDMLISEHIGLLSNKSIQEEKERRKKWSETKELNIAPHVKVSQWRYY
jgi:hypothetical protein